MTEIRGQKSEISKATAFGVIVFALCSLLLAPCSAIEAQQTGKIFRIGFLDSSNASGMAGLLGAFQQELNKLGWIEGKNITFEHRFAEGKPERLPELAADSVHLKVDLIVVSGTPPALTAKKTTLHPLAVLGALNVIGKACEI
jgi:putative ABC transport system substrate-binding protein